MKKESCTGFWELKKLIQKSLFRDLSMGTIKKEHGGPWISGITGMSDEQLSRSLRVVRHFFSEMGWGSTLKVGLRNSLMETRTG